MIDKIKHYPLGKKGLCLQMYNDNEFMFYLNAVSYHDFTAILIGGNQTTMYFQSEEIKPILRPLEQLKVKEIFSGYEGESLAKNNGRLIKEIKSGSLAYGLTINLINKFYDVFGLIEQGKAIAYDSDKHNKCYE